ncbi:hypothetical protein ACFQ8T_16895 [Isoptericola sp. NPDC056618]|uniref:hypothetical protein n=1 Tax=Isoptericola sp. NPDC056618 TaxID=3345878 RepID=UPI00369905E8
MSTSALWRFLPSARRACASLVATGLVLGLATTTAGALPARTLPGSSSATATEATDAPLLDSVFVQEGTPSPHGGQVVAWGDQGGPLDGSSPRALPDGVYAVGLATDEHEVLVLRSDGQVDSYPYDVSGGHSRHLAPAEGATFTAVSVNGNGEARILRSDGVVVGASGEPVKSPPEGLTYTAIAGDLALRSDGTLDPASEPGESCSEARDPGAGLRYTAVTARPMPDSWAALRSDGAYVLCRAGWEGAAIGTVVEPPAGTRFVGIDIGQEEVIAATADGRVLSSGGAQVAAAPPGRSVVSLAAMSEGAGAATLDDGSILSWGLRGKAAAPPVVPEGRDVYSAVGGHHGHGQHWAIAVGDPISVKVSARPVQVPDRPLRVTDVVRLDVTATLEDGTPVAGQAAVEANGPEGQVVTLEPLPLWSGSAELAFRAEQHAQVGSHALTVTFSGSPYATTTAATSLDFAEPSPVALTTSGPATWRQGSEDTLCLSIATEDGSPLWWPGYGQATVTVDGDSATVHEMSGPPGSGASAETCMRELQLEPGSYTAHLDYEGWGEVDSAAWTGGIVVLPPAPTRVESDLSSSWRYGQMPDTVEVDVRSDSLVPVGTARVRHDGMPFGFGAQLDDNGHGRLWIGSEEELLPGIYPMVVEYPGGSGFLPSRLERTVTVQPARFTAAVPGISGTTKVGSTLTAVRATWSPAPTSFRYTWKVDGTAVPGATSKTFTVPASAKGKRITVTVVGAREHYETTSTTSARTAAVAPGTFTTPQPTVSGTRKVGKTLTVQRGTWSPEPSSVTYVWKADGVKIATRSSRTFEVPASAKGRRLTVTVTGSRPGYSTRSVTSARTAVIAPGTFTTPRPTITGVRKVGATLTARRGTWTPVAPSSVRYVWKADGAKIATRESARFVVPARARGKHLTVTVVGSRPGYATKSVASARTTTIR